MSPSVWVLELESVWPWGLVFQLLSELDLTGSRGGCRSRRASRSVGQTHYRMPSRTKYTILPVACSGGNESSEAVADSRALPNDTVV